MESIEAKLLRTPTHLSKDVFGHKYLLSLVMMFQDGLFHAAHMVERE
jgi:hypothetical protein